jgi:hypothetical protein
VRGFSECCGTYFPLGCGSNRRWQFQLGLFRSAVLTIARSDKVLTDAANLLLERSFDLSDLFHNFAGVFLGVALGL